MPKHRRHQHPRPPPAVAEASGRPAVPAAVPAPGRRWSVPARGWQRQALRLTLAVAGPALAVVVLEGALRLAGYGYSTRFFAPLGDGQHLTTNRQFARRFMRRESAPQPYPVVMARHKPPGTLRVFVLGESAALGTPAPAFGFARILEVMLAQQFPEQRLEVVNAAMRGINSHVVLPIARECARHEPDLFLIYLGNNEAIGLYAPEPQGFHAAAHLRLLRAVQWLRATRLAQLLEAPARLLAKPPPRPEQDMDFFRRHALPADHPRRAAVYANFRANLADICRVGRAWGAAVVLCTVAVNLGDFPPLISRHRPDLTAPGLAAWEAAWARGTNAETRGAHAEAIPHYLAARDLDDHFAELHFRLGRCLRHAGRFEEAREAFALARDWDALQFRADRRLNRIVRELAGAGRDPGLFLFDAEQALAEAAEPEHGIPGRRFFYEHVHLTFDGDYALARSLVPVVAQTLGLGEPGKARPLPTRAECAEALGFSAWDEVSVYAAMTRSTAKPPFLEQLDHAARQAQAEAAVRQRLEQFQQQDGFQRSQAAYQAALARRPDDWQIRFNHGNLLSDFHEPAAAAAAYTAAVRIMPAFPPLRIALAQALWDSGQRAQAVQQLEEAARLAPDFAPARDALAKLRRR